MNADFLALADLLQTSDTLHQSKSTSQHNSTTLATGGNRNVMTPGTIGANSIKKKSIVQQHLDNVDTKARYVKLDKNIWNEDDDLQNVEDRDPRPAPEYTISYSQTVRSEDMYLGMMGKQNSIDHCDKMIVKIDMPLIDSAKDVELTVKEELLDVRCADYKLVLALPRKVDEDKGNAKWDKSKKQLVVTLQIIAQFPFS